MPAGQGQSGVSRPPAECFVGGRLYLRAHLDELRLVAFLIDAYARRIVG